MRKKEFVIKKSIQFLRRGEIIPVSFYNDESAIGKVKCWGKLGQSGQSLNLLNGKRATHIAAGDSHNCVIYNDGNVTGKSSLLGG